MGDGVTQVTEAQRGGGLSHRFCAAPEEDLFRPGADEWSVEEAYRLPDDRRSLVEDIWKA
jgi:hypothetical protein